MELFTPNDLDFIRQRGSDPDQVKKQFSHFKDGFPYSKLAGIATRGNGIAVFEKEMLKSLVQFYDQHASNKTIVRFVPASGAATRMFKDLFEALKMDESDFPSTINTFFEQIQNFAFYEDLKPFIQNKDKKGVLNALLTDEGLDYSNLPKGLLKFHIYGNTSRTAIEEHLVESAKYAVCKNRTCFIHFTISPAHQERFAKLIQTIQPVYEKRFKVKYQITFSVQDPATDTLASEANLTPFRDSNGNLLFRPGGHGALISNLNSIDADIIFVKNIDNVTKEHLLQPTIEYKKACAALLIYLQEKCYYFLEILEDNDVDEHELQEIIQFAKVELKIKFPSETPTSLELQEKLNRPIRVCGMVKNQGEPGGGPFWVVGKDGQNSCQIVESSQIDLKNPEQKAIFDQSTHFNPVDMVCSTKDFKGNQFDLHQFVDENTGFISEKSFEGRTLKAMELPGLWNGSMAHWSTIFVEVPLESFNPVKTIFDLLKR